MPTYRFEDSENRTGPVPEGDYVVKVTSASSGLSSTNKEMIKLQLSVNGGGVIFENLVFSEAAYWKIDTFIKSIGIRPPKGTVIEILPQSLIGKIGRAKITIEEYNGKQQNRVEQWYTDWDRSSIEPPQQQKAPTVAPMQIDSSSDDVPF